MEKGVFGMAKDIFRIDFLPHRWLIKTSKLSPEVRGIYIQIISLIYCNEGPIDNDPKWIAQSCGCGSRLVRSAIMTLAEGGFIEVSSEKIGQKRAENTLNAARTRIETASKGGRKLSQIRRETNENKDIIPAGTEKPARANNNNNNSISNNKDTSVSLPRLSPRKAFEADDLTDMAEWFRMNAPAVDPLALKASMLDWCDAKGKTYRDYRAALRNWAKMEQERRNQGETHGQRSSNHPKQLTGRAALAEIGRAARRSIQHEGSQGQGGSIADDDHPAATGLLADYSGRT